MKKWTNNNKDKNNDNKKEENNPQIKDDKFKKENKIILDNNNIHDVINREANKTNLNKKNDIIFHPRELTVCNCKLVFKRRYPMKKWSDPDTIVKLAEIVKEVIIAYFNSKR